MDDYRYSYEFTDDNLRALHSFNLTKDLSLLDASKQEPIVVGQNENGLSGVVTRKMLDQNPEDATKKYFVYFYASNPMERIVPLFVDESFQGKAIPGTLKLSTVIENKDTLATPPPDLKLPEGGDACHPCLYFGMLSGQVFFIIDKAEDKPFQQTQYTPLLMQAIRAQRDSKLRNVVEALVKSNGEDDFKLDYMPSVPEDLVPRPRDHQDNTGSVYPLCLYFPERVKRDNIDLIPLALTDGLYDKYVKLRMEEYKSQQTQMSRSPTDKGKVRKFDPLEWLFKGEFKESDPDSIVFTRENQEILANANIGGKLHLQPNSIVILDDFVLCFYGTCNGMVYPVCWMRKDFIPTFNNAVTTAKRATSKETFFTLFESLIPHVIDIEKTLLAASARHMPYEREGVDEGINETNRKKMYKPQEAAPELFFFLLKGDSETDYPVFVVKDLKHAVKPAEVVMGIERFSDSFLKGTLRPKDGADPTRPNKEWRNAARDRTAAYISKCQRNEEEDKRNHLRYLGNGIGIEAPPGERVIKASTNQPPFPTSFYTPKAYDNFTEKPTDLLPTIDPMGIHKRYYNEGGRSKLYDEKERETKTEINDSKITLPVQKACMGMAKLKKVTLSKATEIPRECFKDCPMLEEVIANVCTAIGDYSFDSCEKLHTVTMPKVKSIGNRAFYNCKNLAKVKFLLVRTIGEGAFLDCDNLNLQDTLKKIQHFDRMAFARCKGMTTLPITSLQKVATTIGDYAFSEFGPHDASPISANLKIGHVQESIGMFAFYQCQFLKNIELTEVRIIGRATFKECYNLEKVTLPAVTTIGVAAFRNCTNLQSVLKAQKLTIIEKRAFLDCKVLKKLHIDPELLEKIGKRALQNCGELVDFELNFEKTKNLGINSLEGAMKIKARVKDKITDVEHAKRVFQACGGNTHPIIKKVIDPKVIREDARQDVFTSN